MSQKRYHLHSNLVIFKSVKLVIMGQKVNIFTFQSGDIQIDIINQ